MHYNTFELFLSDVVNGEVITKLNETFTEHSSLTGENAFSCFNTKSNNHQALYYTSVGDAVKTRLVSDILYYTFESDAQLSSLQNVYAELLEGNNYYQFCDEIFYASCTYFDGSVISAVYFVEQASKSDWFNELVKKVTEKTQDNPVAFLINGGICSQNYTLSFRETMFLMNLKNQLIKPEFVFSLSIEELNSAILKCTGFGYYDIYDLSAAVLNLLSSSRKQKKTVTGAEGIIESYVLYSALLCNPSTCDYSDVASFTKCKLDSLRKERNLSK